MQELKRRSFLAACPLAGGASLARWGRGAGRWGMGASALALAACGEESVEVVDRSFWTLRQGARLWLRGSRGTQSLDEKTIRVWRSVEEEYLRFEQENERFRPRPAEWPATGGVRFFRESFMTSEDSTEIPGAHTLLVSLRLEELSDQPGIVVRLGTDDLEYALMVSGDRLMWILGADKVELPLKLQAGDPFFFALRLAESGQVRMRLNTRDLPGFELEKPFVAGRRSLEQLGGDLEWSAGFLAILDEELSDPQLNDLEQSMGLELGCCGFE